MTVSPVLVAMTGASGAVYGLRLVSRLLETGQGVDLLLSDAAKEVLRHEAGLEFPGDPRQVEADLREYFIASPEQLRHFGLQEWHAPAASGSGGSRAMVVCPCSMGTLAAIAQGMADNLLERAADVAIKEGWRLILVPRETPLSAIHLENMLKLARLGVVILPAMPGFYQRPTRMEELVDFVVDRILDKLGVGETYTGWPPEA